MAKLSLKNQGFTWEMEIPDEKIISVTPNDSDTVVVKFNWCEETKTVSCNKINYKPYG